ncbi:hypothetical protein EJ08DRAFT_583371 [Tothia fuscella]|uniref:White collar n=1 Tax=Tothia fuscella TaxID=1048955 RepID=A0A9P4NZB1_9PEZI|nr:hypothetical protein EJ08DRAFT_583371 [Tothia fuscella]
MQQESIMGAQSLDDIVNQNENEFRRQSMPLPYGPNAGDIDNPMRRVSMMDMDNMLEFGGSAQTGQLHNFQFNPQTTSEMEHPTMEGSSTDNHPSQHRRPSNMDLSINTQFPSQNQYAQMDPSGSVYASPMPVSSALDMDMQSPYIRSAGLPSGIPMSMDMNINPDLYGPSQYQHSPMMTSPVHQDFSNSNLGHIQDQGGGGMSPSKPFHQASSNGATPKFLPSVSRTTSAENTNQSGGRKGSLSAQTSMPPPKNTTPSYASPPRPPQPTGPPQMINGNALPWAAPSEGWPGTMAGRPHTETQYKDIYAPSGYNLMEILVRVGRRPNPQINIGSVDLSCAFVVTNATIHDNPIEYVSESFERLTGYTKHEIRGQNCRFLQSPDGKVESGVKRKYCDDDSVLYLKNCIATRTEAQISLINYRKGGQPFMNLLTMIPIYGDAGALSHFVGLQVDLVENPTAINSKNPDGTFSINYQRHSSLPSYLLQASDSYMSSDYGHPMPRDEVSTVLSTMDSGETELSRRLLDKVLLENADDVIHVLSLKGLFLYLSQACQKVLEYAPVELAGTALSAICHPSDIVPVTRELKDTSSGTSVSVVFRIRRKHSGYMWFESHGSLHTEQGKGRKCIILVGRERPVYTILKSVLLAAGGIGENELWTKMSTTGMFLYVSSNVRQLLDRQPEDLVGTNVQALMRPDSKDEFGRILTLALQGKNTSVRHELTNKRGQVLQAYSWIYPGDALEGQKPTFLVAQIRLIRYHRGGGQRPSLGSREQQHSSGGSMASMASTQGKASHGSATPMSGTTGTNDTTKYTTSDGFPLTTASGQHSLSLGRQDASLASDDNIFEELKTTRSTSWQYELRQMEKRNRILAEEVQSLIAAKKKRKRRRGAGVMQKDCVNCHTKTTPEWRRGPSGQRDLCNSCGLRWAKQVSMLVVSSFVRYSLEMPAPGIDIWY